jgi:hypothetical protein
MPGSDSEGEIDDVEFDNEDIEQEIFDAMEAGVEEATDGDAVCCSNHCCAYICTANFPCNRNLKRKTRKKMRTMRTMRMMPSWTQLFPRLWNLQFLHCLQLSQ